MFQAQQESLQARLFNENLLLNLPVGVVVVDRRYDIREINSAARRLLGIHTVAIGEDLLHLAQNVSNKDFRSAIDKAFRENTVTQLSEVQVPQMTTGEPAYLRIECYPRPHGQNDSGEAGGEGGEEDGPVESVLVLIVEVTEMVQSRREVEQGAALLSARAEELRVANAALAANNEEMRGTNVALEEAHRKAKEVAARHAQQIEVLAEENRKLIAANQEVAARHAQQIEVLAEANRDLLTANQEVTRANSELRTTLDEFLVANEESQAAVEEVETLNEEMQATNEELETLNEEMQATVEELNTSNSDLQARGDELQSLASLLEVQKAQLEAILSGLADAVLVVTQEGKPLLMNEAYKRLFGSGENGEEGENKEADLFNDGADGDGRPARMEDENFRPLLPGETPQSRATRGETFRMTFTLASPLGGERRWLEAIGQPVHGEGGQEWGVVVVRDITERSLRIMQEQFTALAGHELRTPLTSIKGYLHLLDKSLKENGSERQVKHVQIAITQSERLMRLIEDLLDVARLQTGKFSLRQEPLRLDTLLEQAVASAQVLAKGQKIELIVDDRVPAATAAASAHNGDGDSDASDAGGPLLVNGDAARLEQAVLNLLTNAITYAPDSARIDVRLCRVDGTAVDGTPVAVAEIHVQDNGKGIAAKDLSEVFTRFYQVSKGNPLPAQGLGLGLFITREIVEAHGGTISVISAEGKGATFIIRLPLFAQKPEKRADADAHARTDGTA